MSRVDHKRGDDMLPLAVVTAFALALGLRALQNEVGSLGSAAASTLEPLAVIAVLVCALWCGRVAVTRRALRSRVRFAVVPADQLDPSRETVMRLAAQLSRVRRGVRGWLDERASAIRVALVSDNEGRLAYLLEVPGRARELARATLRNLEGIELRDPAGLAAALDTPAGPRAVRAELVLGAASFEPLALPDLDPDPLQGFASALGALRPEQGDRAVVCVDLLPTKPGARRRLRRRLLAQARSHHRPGGGLIERLAQPAQQARSPAELAERRAAGRALDAKLKDAGALFAVQVLVRCESPDRPRAKATLRSLLSTFDALADRNWLRPAGLAIPGVAFLGSDLPLRRRRFDRRLRDGLFAPARRGVVSAREMIGFLKPPTVRCTAANVLRCGALLSPPPVLPAFDGQPDLIPLGCVAGEDGERLVGVRVADTYFSYVAGRSRYGKTELAIGQFLHLVRAGHGGMFLDPHEDAVARIKPHLTDPDVAGRVVEINLAGRQARERQPAWNLFELTGEAADAERKVETIVDAFASALRWDERNSRALTVTTQAAQALAAIARALPAELAPTIFQLPTLLSDDEWRAAALPLLPEASRRFWVDRFPRLSDEAITPVTNLIDRLRASTPITALLGQSQSSYRIREAMDQGLIVLACPGSGGGRDRLIANLLVFDLLHAAKGRADTPPAGRRPFFAVLDEVQSYDGAASDSLAGLLEQAAKYGVKALLLNQNPERLSSQTLNAVTTNRSHLLASALNAKAAGLIAREWGAQPDPAAITRLARYQFLGQVTHRGQVTAPLRISSMPVEKLFGRGRPDRLDTLERAIDDTSGRRPVAEALRHLDSLDERIREELARSASGQKARTGRLVVPDRGGRR